tara:strand:- start:46652 stop:47791 length:1140 start_codon:yes stop_codon:yes gene_type:complete
LIQTSKYKHIVLVGGGHTHALLLKQWIKNPLPGTRLSLISPQNLTPYSGMLPGLIAGHYTYEDIHIDLPALCAAANVEFLQASVFGINPDSKTLQIHQDQELHYDLLSLDIGSTPDHSVPGVHEYAIPVKPIATFYQHWLKVQQKITAAQNKQKLVLIGGGAGGVEVMLAMAWALENNPQSRNKTEYSLAFGTADLLPAYPKKTVTLVKQLCRVREIKIYPNFSVKLVAEPALISHSSETLTYDHLFWCTQASAADWLAKSGLACNQDGFVRVNQFLQSISHDDIFAAGDIAHMDLDPRPKAGVYAVRQAPYLYENIRNHLLNEKLTAYKPQDNFLSLLSLGNKVACAYKKPFPVFSGAWVWRWKNHIDQTFMDQFRHL